MKCNKIIALKYAQDFCKIANGKLKPKNIICGMEINGQIKLFYVYNNKTYYFADIDIKQLELLVISQFRHFDLTKDNINLIYDCLLTDINLIPSITDELVANIDYGHFLGNRICKIICESFDKFVINLAHQYEFNIIMGTTHVCITMSRYIPIDNDWVEYGRILSINTKTLYLSSAYTSPWLYSLYTKDVMNTYIDNMRKYYKTLIEIYYE